MNRDTVITQTLEGNHQGKEVGGRGVYSKTP